jgi:BlaI family transcriptional regulator, penicillinase repressor
MIKADPANEPSSTTISDAESQVMEVLWHTSPLSTESIAQALQGQRDWQLATIKTLLNRLLNKGAISAEKDGRRYLYSALLSREAWLKGQSLGLLDRLFDGRLAPLVAHFSTQRRLSAADLAALKQLIKEQERG